MSKTLKNKLVIRGGYGLTNFGDDALMKVIYDEFVEDKQDIIFSSTYADYIKILAPLANFLPLSNNYNDIDFLIYGGGTQFYSFKPKKTIYKKIIGLIKNPKVYLNKYLINKEKEVVNESLKIAALGIGLGPFLPDSNPEVEIYVKELFKKMSFIAVRDYYSKAKCEEWKLGNYYHFTDICYASNHHKYLKNNNENKLTSIGVVVRDWTNTIEGSSYTNELIESVKELRLANFKVTFIVFAKGKDSKWLKTLKNINEEVMIWDPYKYSIDEFIEKLSLFDLFITARYHGAIYSSLLGKPFISIEVEQKLKMIHEVFIEGSEVWSYPFRKVALLENVDKIKQSYVTYSSSIVDVAKKNMGRANKMKFEFQKFINNN